MNNSYPSHKLRWLVSNWGNPGTHDAGERLTGVAGTVVSSQRLVIALEPLGEMVRFFRGTWLWSRDNIQRTPGMINILHNTVHTICSSVSTPTLVHETRRKVETRILERAVLASSVRGRTSRRWW